MVDWLVSGISKETRERISQHWPEILTALAAGELVAPLLARYGISRGEQRAYMADLARKAEWEEAREQSAHAFLEEAMEVARTPNSTPVGAADARTRIDTLKWAARIRNPRLYGDKAQLDVNVRTVDLTRIIQDANARLAAAQAGRIIEGAVLRPELEKLL